MTNLPPVPLTRSGDRARAASIVAADTGITVVEAFRLMDTVDAVTAAVLTTAGLDETTTRRVLTALWQQPTPTHTTTRPVNGLRVSDVEWTFLRDSAPASEPYGPRAGSDCQRSRGQPESRTSSFSTPNGGPRSSPCSAYTASRRPWRSCRAT